MLDLELIANDPDAASRQLARRNVAGAGEIVGRLLALNDRRRQTIAALETLKAKKNTLSKEFGQRKKAGADTAGLTAELNAFSGEIPALETQITAIEAELLAALQQIPNLPDEEIPDGDETHNQEISRWGGKPAMGFTPKAHEEIGEQLGILDFERAVKLSGSRFVVLKGAGARLERALINFMLDLHTGTHGYTEIFPPLMVKRETPLATGHLPKGWDGMFVAFNGSNLDPEKEQKEFPPGSVERNQYYLIPTAELPLTALHADEILPEASLPVRYVSFTPCFRSEAGSYGKDVKGMLRQHQFQKVELYQITHPDKSREAHEELTGQAEKILQLLGLHYRKMLLAAGDMGFAARRTYDLEVWLPSQNAFREISSCSNCGDFQARRAKIRFKDAQKKNRLVHTLNGSGLAVGRTLIAILENYQQADGSVVIPEALRPYLGGIERISR
jgi:seryl-tRNA synthetase